MKNKQGVAGVGTFRTFACTFNIQREINTVPGVMVADPRTLAFSSLLMKHLLKTIELFLHLTCVFSYA